MDQAVEVLGMPTPDFIKMDVDGIEHFLLQGGTQVLRNVQGVLVEINDDFAEQAEISKKILEEAGLHLLDKRHSEMVKDSEFGFENTYNQIWARLPVKK